MKRLVVSVFLLAATYSHGETPQLMRGEDAERLHLLVANPRPEYPYEARRKLVTGSGVFILRFDYETGRLRQVHIFTSTGNQLLDTSTVAALKQWQAKPRSLHDLAVPVTFATSAGRR